MEHVRTFLESSSIHGLTHISRNRKFKQVFWFLVVVFGFILAFTLIYTSFQSWHESPVKTMTETLPITEMKLPKVTVCPPKNTFTDLNYDLMLAEETKLSDDKREELYKFAIQNAEESSFMDALNLVQEEKRFYNWYHGFSSINPMSDHSTGMTKLIFTSALSGSVGTEDYGHEFNPYLVWRNVDYRIYLYPQNNPNSTLHIEIEKLSMTGLDTGKDIYKVNGGTTADGEPRFWDLDADKDLLVNKFKPPGNSWYLFILDRKLGKEDIRQLDLKQMPGFRFRWYYTGGNMTEPNKIETKYNGHYHEEFIR